MAHRYAFCQISVEFLKNIFRDLWQIAESHLPARSTSFSIFIVESGAVYQSFCIGSEVLLESLKILVCLILRLTRLLYPPATTDISRLLEDLDVVWLILFLQTLSTRPSSCSSSLDLLWRKLSFR